MRIMTVADKKSILLLVLTPIYNCNEELLYIRLGKPLMDKNPRRSSRAPFLCSPPLSRSMFLYYYTTRSTNCRGACSLG